jgi:hypothetical protein
MTTGSTPESSRCAAYAAAFHDLAERLTAAGSYLAAGLRLSEEGDASDAATRRTLVLCKAVEQLDQATEVLSALRTCCKEENDG